METKDLENIPDDILLARIKNGDDDARGDLIQKYEQRLKTIIQYKIRNAEAEKDVYQETCVAILRRIDLQGVDNIESVEQWIKQVARSKCQQYFVDAKKHSVREESFAAYYRSAVEEAEHRRVTEERLRDDIEELRMFVVEELDPIHVEVFELWAQGLTEKESAAELGISPNTVKSRRNRIRKFLREHVGVSPP